MAYHFLDHTADVKFVAEAETLEDSFIESARALQESICGKITILEQQTKEIKIEASNMESLLYKFLEEFLVLLDSEDFLTSKIKSIKIDPKSFKLEAIITGDKAENYKFTNDVKAVTYNEMTIEQNLEKNNWKIQVVLDV